MNNLLIIYTNLNYAKDNINYLNYSIENVLVIIKIL